MTSGENNRFIAEQLSRLPSANRSQIILLLRNQYDYAYSVWCHYIREGGGLSLKNFLSTPSSPVKPGSTGEYAYRHHGLYQKLMYGEYVQFLQSLFGKSNTHILFFEDFRADFQAFMRNLYGLMGVCTSILPENKVVVPTGQKISGTQANALRIFNHFSSTLHLQPLLRFPTLSTYSRNRGRLISALNKWLPKNRLNPEKFTPSSVSGQDKRIEPLAVRLM